MNDDISMSEEARKMVSNNGMVCASMTQKDCEKHAENSHEYVMLIMASLSLMASALILMVTQYGKEDIPKETLLADCLRTLNENVEKSVKSYWEHTDEA